MIILNILLKNIDKNYMMIYLGEKKKLEKGYLLCKEIKKKILEKKQNNYVMYIYIYIY